MATIGTDKEHTFERRPPQECNFLVECDVVEAPSMLSIAERPIIGNRLQAECLKTTYLDDDQKDSKDFSTGSFNAYFQANFSPANFPRFDYHLDLVLRMDESVHHRDVDDIPKSILKTIVIYGRKANINRELLHPLQLQEINEKEQSGNHVIMVVFTDVTDEEHETLNFIEDEMEKSTWCIIVTSNPVGLRYANHTTLAKSRKCSLVLPDLDAVWSHLTSALELSLIEYLNRLITFSKDKDTETVLRRIEKCSDFPEMKKMQKSRIIPEDIKTVLKRFAKYIVRYGFHFKKFRIIVKQEKYEEVLHATNQATNQTCSNYFPEVQVLSDDNFEETVEPYTGVPQAQGMKLYQLPEEPKMGDDLYCTLGSLALLNDKDTVALSSRHICENGDSLYIDKNHRQSAINIDNRRTPLGRCLYTPSGRSAYYNDMAIIELTEEIKNNFNEKRILDNRGVANKAEIMKFDLDDLDLTGEIVHKFGAATQWTIGKVVCSELLNNEYHFIGVEGMHKKEFGEHGDSGSIIFRKTYDAINGHLEVVAMLYGGDKKTSNAQENPTKLIYCSGFEKAFEMIKKRYSQVKSISFF